MDGAGDRPTGVIRAAGVISASPRSRPATAAAPREPAAYRLRNQYCSTVVQVNLSDS